MTTPFENQDPESENEFPEEFTPYFDDPAEESSNDPRTVSSQYTRQKSANFDELRYGKKVDENTYRHRSPTDHTQRGPTDFRGVGDKHHHHKSATKMKGPLAIGRFGAWMGVSVAVSAYFVQLFLSLFALLTLGIHALLEEWWAKPLKWIGDVLGTGFSWMLNLDTEFSTETLFFAFWGLSFIVAICTFFGFVLWYYFTGIKVFHSVMSILITGLCLALSLLPVSNLFPWIVLWVIYINSTSLFSTVKHMATGS